MSDNSCVYTSANINNNGAVPAPVTLVSSGSGQTRTAIQPPVTRQKKEEDNKSKKMNFSLKLDKFSGACNDDAKSWLLQFAQYCTCYDLVSPRQINTSKTAAPQTQIKPLTLCPLRGTTQNLLQGLR